MGWGNVTSDASFAGRQTAVLAEISAMMGKQLESDPAEAEMGGDIEEVT